MNNVFGILPEIVLAVTAMLVLLTEPVARRGGGRGPAMLAIGGLLVALVVGPYGLTAIGCDLQDSRDLAGCLSLGPNAASATEIFGGFLQVDAFTTFLRSVFIVLALIGVAVSPAYLRRRGIPAGEYYAMVLFSTIGAMTIALASDLITLFLGLELMTIPIYVLAGMQRRDRASNEAALKYFLLGAFSSALLLYGFTWLYGVTGATSFGGITAVLERQGATTGPVIVALALITVGLGFKAAVIPFHQWTPDAYDGAPTPATAFMSVAPKAAAFAAFLQIFYVALWTLQVDWSVAFAVLAALTMTGGNLVALAQRNVKRMLAYSSIAHTGYILAAVASVQAGGNAVGGVLFYLAAYGLMNLGAFACLLFLDTEGTRGATLTELSGFAKRHPIGGLLFTVFLVSLTGIPPTVGFIAKVFVLQPVLEAGLTWLAVLIALNAAVAAFYYLRVVVHLYMYDPEEGAPRVVRSVLLQSTLGATAVAVVALGIVPNTLFSWALEAAAPLLR